MITLKPITVGKTRRINRAPESKEFVMEGFLEPGLVSYEDVGDGISRLDKPAIDKMLNSFVGCPLIINHVDDSKHDILNGKKDHEGNDIKVGEVTRAWWNAQTGKYDCAFVTENEKALKLIMDEGWSGSCAYNVKEPLGPAGELHAMRYDNTILDGVFEHLALVSNPRYEDCAIRMNGKAAKIRENDHLGDIELANSKTVTLKNANPRAQKLAEETVEEILNPTENSTISYGLEKGYTRAEGQEAWSIIFRETKSLNSKTVILRNSINFSALDPYEKRVASDMISKGRSLEEVCTVMVNTVEGDETQLSPELLKFAKSKGLLNSKKNVKTVVLKNKHKTI
jgi:hypothetical protein